jgi:hypothetical protein
MPTAQTEQEYYDELYDSVSGNALTTSAEVQAMITALPADDAKDPDNVARKTAYEKKRNEFKAAEDLAATGSNPTVLDLSTVKIPLLEDLEKEEKKRRDAIKALPFLTVTYADRADQLAKSKQDYDKWLNPTKADLDAEYGALLGFGAGGGGLPALNEAPP